MVVPFEPMWNVARAGTLEVGEPAPDFALRSADKNRLPFEATLKRPLFVVGVRSGARVSVHEARCEGLEVWYLLSWFLAVPH